MLESLLEQFGGQVERREVGDVETDARNGGVDGAKRQTGGVLQFLLLFRRGTRNGGDPPVRFGAARFSPFCLCPGQRLNTLIMERLAFRCSHRNRAKEG